MIARAQKSVPEADLQVGKEIVLEVFRFRHGVDRVAAPFVDRPASQ